jgi:hypothetical protein
MKLFEIKYKNNDLSPRWVVCAETIWKAFDLLIKDAQIMEEEKLSLFDYYEFDKKFVKLEY